MNIIRTPFYLKNNVKPRPSCKNCIFYLPTSDQKTSNLKIESCLLFTYEITDNYLDTERSRMDKELCGPDGKYFQIKEK